MTRLFTDIKKHLNQSSEIFTTSVALTFIFKFGGFGKHFVENNLGICFIGKL